MNFTRMFAIKMGNLKFILEVLIMKEITYRKEGDYLIPDLAVKGTNFDYHIGLYGRLKLEYMKKHSLGLYSDLILMVHYQST